MPALPQLGAITHVTQHCTATPEGLNCSAKQISDMDIARFGQVSYHYVVLLDGTLVNTLGVQFKGAHTGGHNTGNVGISYVGGIDRVTKQPKDTRTPAQKTALATLVRTYQQRVPGITVRGHNEWPGVTKACPSFDVSDWLKAGMPV